MREDSAATWPDPRRERRRRTSIVVALLAACGSDPLAPPERPIALFDLPRPAAPAGDFYGLPFPNDLRVRADGTVDLDTHPSSSLALDTFLDAAAVAPGFSGQQAVFFRFSGPIDAATLPADPAASVAAAASVYLVVVDPASPRRGERAPASCRFSEPPGTTIGANRLSCLPVAGLPLEPATTYAAVVTTRLLAGDGEAPERAPDFEALLTGGGDQAVAAARETYAPLLDWLDEPGGDEREDVVSAAVYTTQDPIAIVRRAREVVRRDVAAPVGVDVVLAETTAAYRLYTGRYSAPSFQRGVPPYSDGGGDIVVDDGGDPVVQGSDSIRFAVAYPTGPAPPTGWPVVLFAHGTGGDYLSFTAGSLAADLADAGLASIGIDAPLHGERAPLGSDPSITFFNAANPAAMRDNVRQSAIDGFQLVRLVEALSPPDPDAVLDPDRISFIGHSQGGITGTPFVASEPLVRGAVISAAGGPFYLSLLEKREPADLRELFGVLLGDPNLDEHNNVVALLQMGQETADPVAYAPLVVPGARDVLAIEGIGDAFTPNATAEALAVALGTAPVEPVLTDIDAFALIGTAPVRAPVTANAGGRTAVLVQATPEAMHDPHFILFEDPVTRARAIAFLATLASDGVATLP